MFDLFHSGTNQELFENHAITKIRMVLCTPVTSTIVLKWSKLLCQPVTQQYESRTVWKARNQSSYYKKYGWHYVLHLHQLLCESEVSFFYESKPFKKHLYNQSSHYVNTDS